MGKCWAWLTSRLWFTNKIEENDCLLEMSPVKVIQLQEEYFSGPRQCCCGSKCKTGPGPQFKFSSAGQDATSRTSRILYSRRKSLKEIFNPAFLRRKTKDDKVSCLFKTDKNPSSLNSDTDTISFSGHDVTLCVGSSLGDSHHASTNNEWDVRNGNISGTSKHGSVSTLNMEWDSQDCFKDEDIKEKCLLDHQRFQRKHSSSVFSPRLTRINSPLALSRVRAMDTVSSQCSSMSSLAWDCQGTDIKDDDNQDADTENFLVEIDCLTSKVLRETSLWNIQSKCSEEVSVNSREVTVDVNENCNSK